MGQGIGLGAGVVSRARPSPIFGDNQAFPPRLNHLRDLMVELKSLNFNGMADEGSYFAATTGVVTGIGNPGTNGTAIAYAINAAFSDTVAMIAIRNTASPSDPSAKVICPDLIRIVQGATVPATATAGQFVIKKDGTVRATAGTLLTPFNTFGRYTNSTVADVRYMPSVTAVTGDARTIERGCMRSVIPVANDEWIFVFGSIEKAASISLGGAVAQRMIIPAKAAPIQPGETLLLHVWFPGNATTAGQFEADVGWYER